MAIEGNSLPSFFDCMLSNFLFVLVTEEYGEKKLFSAALLIL